MTSTNARRLIQGACLLFGGVAQGETPTAEQEQDAYAHLNELIDQWATQPWTTYTITRVTFSLAASVSSTTIGVGGTIDQYRPERILRAAYVNPTTSGTTTLETPIPVVLFEQYASLALKSMTSTLPTALYYNPTSPLGTINVWPILTQTVTMVLYLEAPLAQFTDLTTETIFPPGYFNALKYQLSCLLAPEWGMDLPDGIEKRANLYLNDLKRANLRISTMPNAWNQAMGRGTYDIFSDTVR